jgi:hypothetical protein
VLSAPAWWDSCNSLSDRKNTFRNRIRALNISPQMPLKFLLQYVYLKFQPKRLLLKGFLLNDSVFFVFQEESFLDDEVQ